MTLDAEFGFVCGRRWAPCASSTRPWQAVHGFAPSVCSLCAPTTLFYHPVPWQWVSQPVAPAAELRSFDSLLHLISSLRSVPCSLCSNLYVSSGLVFSLIFFGNISWSCVRHVRVFCAGVSSQLRQCFRGSHGEAAVAQEMVSTSQRPDNTPATRPSAAQVGSAASTCHPGPRTERHGNALPQATARTAVCKLVTPMRENRPTAVSGDCLTPRPR